MKNYTRENFRTEAGYYEDLNDFVNSLVDKLNEINIHEIITEEIEQDYLYNDAFFDCDSIEEAVEYVKENWKEYKK